MFWEWQLTELALRLDHLRRPHHFTASTLLPFSAWPSASSPSSGSSTVASVSSVFWEWQLTELALRLDHLRRPHHFTASPLLPFSAWPSASSPTSGSGIVASVFWEWQLTELALRLDHLSRPHHFTASTLLPFSAWSSASSPSSGSGIVASVSSVLWEWQLTELTLRLDHLRRPHHFTASTLLPFSAWPSASFFFGIRHCSVGVVGVVGVAAD